MIKIILISLALIFVIIGALISALAAIGLLRLEDVYSRAHAAGKSINIRCNVITIWYVFYILLLLKVL